MLHTVTDKIFDKIEFCVLFQIKLVEVVGRRILMLIGLGGMFVFYAVMTLAFCLQVDWVDCQLGNPTCAIRRLGLVNIAGLIPPPPLIPAWKLGRHGRHRQL